MAGHLRLLQKSAARPTPAPAPARRHKALVEALEPIELRPMRNAWMMICPMTCRLKIEKDTPCNARGGWRCSSSAVTDPGRASLHDGACYLPELAPKNGIMRLICKRKRQHTPLPGMVRGAEVRMKVRTK